MMPGLPQKFRLARGRALPRVLFVTDEEKLKIAVNDPQGVTALLKYLETQKDQVGNPHGVSRVQTTGLGALAVVQQVRADLAKATYEGVVLLGGYDVVPSLTVDCLSPGATALRSQDDDNFTVWCDDRYGDVDGDTVPELPVSRVPDGHDFGLMCKALSAPACPAQAQGQSLATFVGDGGIYGLRSRFVDFAAVVFNGLTPLAMAEARPFMLGDRLPDSRDPHYLVLHGKREDNSVFFGRVGPNQSVEAVSFAELPDALDGSLVLSGCCWGALIVEEPADLGNIDQGVTARLSVNSLALRALELGACAWIGHTGLQHTPEDEAGNPNTENNLARPMHALILTHYIVNGKPPAKALFDAKNDYVDQMPHGVFDSDWHCAAESKTFLQTTCLGLGW
jgi:hypothetical protein